MQRFMRLLCALCFLAWPPTITAEPPAARIDPQSLLPPTLAWDGASRSLIAEADDPWRTPAETSAFRTTHPSQLNSHRCAIGSQR